MYRKSGDSWLKHLDFIVLDLVALQLAYISSYALRMGAGNLYKNSLYPVSYTHLRIHMPAEAAVDAQRQHWLLIFCQSLRAESGERYSSCRPVH